MKHKLIRFYKKHPQVCIATAAIAATSAMYFLVRNQHEVVQVQSWVCPEGDQNILVRKRNGNSKAFHFTMPEK